MLSTRVLAATLILALLLVTAVPVDAAPALQKGAHSSYDLSVSISSFETCGTIGTTTPKSMIVCPMPATFPISTNITGTIGWTVTDLTNTAASLNVTRNLTISSNDSTRPVIPSVGRFNESIDLATRLVSFFPSIMPEIDQFLQNAQTTSSTSLAGLNLSGSLQILEGTLPKLPFYTMWWVNGPLKPSETIPVLVLPTNVTGNSSVDLGGFIGQRDAWTLTFGFARVMPDPALVATQGLPVSDSLSISFVFNYDKTSDLLLSASAEIHTGFENEVTIPPPSCTPSASMACPATSSPTTIMRSFGLNIEASLKLSSTTVDLSQRMTEIPPTQNNGGTQPNGGPDNGNNGSGSITGTNGPGSDANNKGATGSTGQPSSNSNQRGYLAQLSIWPSWIYALLGILAAAVISSGAWVARRHSEGRTNNPSNQAYNRSS